MFALLKALNPLYKIGGGVILALSLWGSIEVWDYFDDKEAVEVHEIKVNKAIDIKVKKHESDIKETFTKPVSTELNDFADGLLKQQPINTPKLHSLSPDTQHADQQPEGNYTLGSPNRLDAERIRTYSGETESTETLDCLHNKRLELLYIAYPHIAPDCINGKWEINQ